MHDEYDAYVDERIMEGKPYKWPHPLKAVVRPEKVCNCAAGEKGGYGARVAGCWHAESCPMFLAEVKS